MNALEIYNGSYDVNSFNLFYKEVSVAGVNTPTLIIGEAYYIYSLPMVIASNTVTISTINSPKWHYENYHQGRWYQLEESYFKFIIGSIYYMTIYDMSTDKDKYFLCNFSFLRVN